MTMALATTSFASFAERVRADIKARADEQIARLSWSAEEIRAAQRDSLRRLLRHAVERSPFHRARLAGIDVDRVEPDDLTALPVMTKAEMMSSLDDVFTDHRLTRAGVERAVESAGQEPAMVADHLVMATGGSSGERGLFVFDCHALATFLGGVSRSMLRRLVAVGGPPPGGLPIAMVAASSPIHATGVGQRIGSAEAGMPFRFLPVPVTLPLREIVDRLNELQAPVLYGYASILERLAAEQRAGRLAISPFAVTSTSETLTSEARAAITEAFGAPVVNTFGSTEGLIGTTAPGEEVITFASDLCIVELLDDAVLVTNLFNLAQPLIRYELNDVFVRGDDAPDHGHLRATVQGRADDVLRFDGGVDIHPGVVRSVLLHVPKIVDYRVLQTRRGIDVEAVTEGGVDVGALRDRLADALGGAGLAGAEVGVRLVDEVGRHRDTGKLRRFVPLA